MADSTAPIHNKLEIVVDKDYDVDSVSDVASQSHFEESSSSSDEENSPKKTRNSNENTSLVKTSQRRYSTNPDPRVAVIQSMQQKKEKEEVSPEDVSLGYTFWFMKKRQWERMYRGSHQKPENRTILWFLFFGIIYGSYLFFQMYYFRRLKDWILEFLLYGFMSLSCAIVISKFEWFARLMLIEIYGGFYIFFVGNFYYQTTQYIPLILGTTAVVLTTLLIFLIYPVILRLYIICTNSLTPTVQQANKEKNDETRVEIVQRTLCWTSLPCVYQGKLVDGKPDGWGTWIDRGQTGEFLQGYWDSGIPVGPFHSIENGTRSMLVNLRIFFATDGGGKFWLERTPLHFGVASVECCISGNFFKGYPQVENIVGPNLCDCSRKCECLADLMKDKRFYRHIDEEKETKTVVVSIDKNHMTVSGFKSKNPTPKKVEISIVKDQEKESSKRYRLGLDENWLQSHSSEAILFLHGYDHNLEDSVKRFGQFLAMAHLPPNFIPFVFNWPSSTNPLLYWCAHSVASDNDIHRDLKRFLKSLRHAGIRTLHVMCHSMGTRFFLRAFSTIRSLFRPRLNLHRNSESYSDLGELSADNYTESSPANTNTQDSRLDSKIKVENLIFMSPDYELETFKNDYATLRYYSSKITVYADHRDAAVRIAFNMTTKPSLGNNIAPVLDAKGNPLDIDIIDTGDLDRNTNSMFHSFFNINKLMVDDLSELLETGKRAEHRTSRLRKSGNVFRFAILPSTVVMV